MAKVNWRADMEAALVVTANHAARSQIRVRNGLGQRVDAPVADIELRQKFVPLRKGSRAEDSTKEIDDRLLVRARPP
jgi:hypothetical protein